MDENKISTTKNQRRKARKKLKRESGPVVEKADTDNGEPFVDPLVEALHESPSENLVPNISPTLTKCQRRKVRKKLRRETDNDDKPSGRGISHNIPRSDAASIISDRDTTTAVADHFTIIGEQKSKKKEKLPPFLPAWYSAPIPISTGLKNSLVPVEDITGLDEHFVCVLREQGIEHFFPVQSAIIPDVLGYQTFQRYYARRPPDLCVCAPTGSGKTLAYVLPILQDLQSRTTRRIRALVLLPGKELAIQVADVFQTFSKGTRVRVALLCGKQSLEQERRQLFVENPMISFFKDSLPEALEKLQLKEECAVDVVVATPGRLVDHLYETAGLDMQALEYLVVDEADRMIEEFKNNWFRLLERAVFRNPEIRPALQYTCAADFEKPSLPLQKLLFSATLSYDPQRFETLKLYRPKLFSAVSADSIEDPMLRTDAEVVGAYVTPDGLKELLVQTDPRLKPLVILHFLYTLRWKRVLIFTNSLENTHRLFLLIKLFEGQSKVAVQEISSSVHQRKRQTSLEGFEKGTVDVIVASDSMARGIDLPNVEYVLLYDAPLHAKTYIHRSGRTARAGKKGTTLTLIKPDERKDFQKIVKELKKPLPERMVVAQEELSMLEVPYTNALQKLQSELEAGHR